MKKTWVIVLLFVVCLAANAQVGDLPRSYVYLILNQPKYAPGDTVFFKAYFLQEDNTAVTGKQLLDLNLVDESGNSRVHFKFSVKDGIGENQFVIPNSLSAGIYLLTTHSSWMLNFDPPGIFQEEMKIVTDHEIIGTGETEANLGKGIDGSEAVEIEIGENAFNTREKVSMRISLLDTKGNPIEGEFSVRVLNQSLFQEAGNTLVDQVNAATQKPTTSASGEPRHFYSSILERTGTAYNADTSEPLPDFTQVVFYLQNSHWRYQTFTNNAGRVSLAIPDFYGEDEFFYFGMTKQRQEVNNIRIVWDDEPTLALPNAPSSRESNERDSYASFAEKQQIINRSYSFYTSDLAVESEESGMANLEELLGGADASYNVNDYARFATMKELIKEVIKFMKQRGSGDKTRVRISLLEPPIGDPLYIIDGIATKNTAFFLSLEPSKLKTIKIIKDQFKLPKLGLFGKNGIVLVETKEGNVREPLDDDAKLVQGLKRPYRFGNITESDVSNTAVPLFRSTIYWNPSVITYQNGQAEVAFYTSDDIGTYHIGIDGTTAEGEAFSVSKTIEVKADNP